MQYITWLYFNGGTQIVAYGTEDDYHDDRDACEGVPGAFVSTVGVYPHPADAKAKAVNVASLTGFKLEGVK